MAKRTFQMQVAKKVVKPLKVNFQGPSGGGKTYSALRLASGLVDGDMSKVAFIDTEAGSSTNYVRTFPGFLHIDFEAPFSPTDLIDLIEDVEAMGDKTILVIDSTSHFYEGTGGLLDIADAAKSRTKGNSWAAWRYASPVQQKLIDKILTTKLNIITTTRSKTEWAKDDKGAPIKVGLASKQKEGWEYEFDINFELNDKKAIAGKDRTGLFSDTHPFQITEDIGRELIAWANDGEIRKAPEPKAYEASGEQKTALMGWFKEWEIPTDKMKDYSEHLKAVQVPFVKDTVYSALNQMESGA